MSAKRNINNLKKVSTILPQIFKKINKKGNSQLLEIKMNWTSIMGKEYSEKCYVSSLKKINGFFLRKVVDIIKFKKLLQT